MEKKMTENGPSVQKLAFLVILTILYPTKPYQTYLNVLVRSCRKHEKRWLKTVHSFRSKHFWPFSHTLPNHTKPVLNSLLGPAKSVEKKMTENGPSVQKLAFGKYFFHFGNKYILEFDINLFHNLTQIAFDNLRQIRFGIWNKHILNATNSRERLFRPL